MRSGPARIEWSATVVLVVMNIAAFLLQCTVLPRAFELVYLDLSAGGLRSGYLWQLVTFQFLHGSLGHIFFNCLTLYLFGRAVESALGTRKFVMLYFCSGVFGGLLHAFAAIVWPNYFDVPVVGASAGIFGVVAAFAMLFPDQPLLFMFVINMRARTLLWVELVITALGIGFPNSRLVISLFGNMAHAAHLGGILTGLAFIRLGEEFRARSSGWDTGSQGRSPFKLPRWTSSSPAGKSGSRPEEFISTEVDPILDKISAHGIQSLTERERKILDAARRKMDRR